MKNFLTNKIPLRKKWICFLALLVVYLINAVFGNHKHFFNDDVIYAKYAAQYNGIGTLICTYCDHFSFRVVPIAVTSLAYKLFGINQFGSMAVTIGAFTVVGILLWKLLSNEKITIRLISVALFLFNYTVLKLSKSISADALVCLFNLGAFYFYIAYAYQLKIKLIYSALFFAICIMLSILSKETPIIFAPFWIILISICLIKNTNRNFWLLSCSFLGLLMVIYLFTLKVSTGSWIGRYNILTFNSKSGGSSYSDFGFIAILKRVLYELWYEWLVQGSLIILLPAIMSLAYINKMKFSPQQKLIVFSCSGLLLCSNFMSFTLNAYNPLWPEARHFLFVLPFATIAASYFIVSYLKEPKQFIWFPFLCFFQLVLFIIFNPDATGMKIMYFIYAMAAILIYHYSNNINPLFSIIKLSIIGMPILLVYLYSFFNENNKHIGEIKWLIEKLNKDSIAKQEKIYIFGGDETTLGLCQYFLKFQHPNIHFSRLDSCDDIGENFRRRNFLITSASYNPKFANKSIQILIQSKQSKLYLQNYLHNCSLYEIYNTKILSDLKKHSNPQL